MKRILYNCFTIYLLWIAVSCGKNSHSDYADDIGPSSTESYADLGLTTEGEASTAQPPPTEAAGKITAGEWNDLENWTFWNNLLNEKTYAQKSEMWDFYTNNRVSVWVKDTEDKAVCNTKVTLKKAQSIIWETKTDNFGKAELWIGLHQVTNAELSQYTLEINDKPVDTSIELIGNGIQEITVSSNDFTDKKIELAFIVDATGSMGDELEFLKKDLENVIQKVTVTHPEFRIETSTVFYRDKDDNYVVRHSEFTPNIAKTLNFIRQQEANGGGDFPEAVHTALNTALQDLQWSDKAYTRIAFLLLDAPPHHNPEVINHLHQSTQLFAKKGIKIIPITASGIDKDTEFLMRFLAIATNGTYVFITNHSGIGNDHIEASVGDYEVELLNNLMVRLINKYTE